MCFFLLLFIFAPSLQLEDAVHFRLLFCSLHVWTQILAVGNRPASSSSSSVRNDCFRKLCWNIYEMLQQSLRNSADLRVFVNFLKLSQSLRKHSSDTINEHEWKMNLNMQVTSVTCGRSALCARIPRMCFHLLLSHPVTRLWSFALWFTTLWFSALNGWLKRHSCDGREYLEVHQVRADNFIYSFIILWHLSFSDCCRWCIPQLLSSRLFTCVNWSHWSHIYIYYIFTLGYVRFSWIIRIWSTWSVIVWN